MNQPKSIFPIWIVCSIFVCLLLLGCLGRTKPVTDGSVEVTANNDAEVPIRSEKQNLSMAEKLKNATPKEYILGPEDTIKISVFQHAELTMNTTVSSTGKISYYLIDDIQAAGMTQFQLRDKVRKELTQYIKNPKVVIRIIEYRSHKIFVLGQIKTPGVFRMRNNYSLLEAISLAGGITSNAYLGGAYVVRDGQALLVNFVDMIEKGDTREDIPLQAGDVVYIPDSRNRQVYVLGEVNKQSALPIRGQLSLLGAIAQAGGFTQDAQMGKIFILRGNLSRPEFLQVDASNLKNYVDIPLKQGDIIYVATSGFAKVERAAGRITEILNSFLTATQGVVLTKAAKEVLQGQSYNINVGFR